MKLNLTNFGILGGAAAVAYLLYIATKPANTTGFISTGTAAVNTDGQGYVKTFQDDSALSQDMGLIYL